MNENEYSFSSIKEEVTEAKETTVFFSPLDETYTEINLDTALREQVSANTAKLAEHEIFISDNQDIKEVVEELGNRIQEFDGFNYVIHDDFDGNIDNYEEVPSLEKIVNDIRQIVYALRRDYGTLMNTGDLIYQNQEATKTIEELNRILEDNQNNILPIRNVVNEVKNARVTYFGEQEKENLKARLSYDFSVVATELEKVAQYEGLKDVIADLQSQINDIIENGVRQDIIDAIYVELNKIKADIEWLKENGGGGGGTKPDPTPESELPDGNIIQQCLNVFLITNTTLFRMKSVVEENQGLVEYIVYQITVGNLDADKVFECYPYLEETIKQMLMDKAVRTYNIQQEMKAMTALEMINVCAEDIEEETDILKLNRIIQETLNVFIHTNATTVRTRSVLEEEQGFVDYIVQQLLNRRMEYKDVAKEYPHLADTIYEKFIQAGGIN